MRKEIVWAVILATVFVFAAEAAEKTFKCEEQFLLLPIKNNGKGCNVVLKLGDKEIRNVGGKFAETEAEVDWWGFFDISQYKGQEVTLNVGNISDEGFAMMKQAAKVPGSEKWGDEPKRPQFHYSQRVGWNNDPNGMVYYKGEWHLYLQHNPVALPWGNMTWAHGVSKDLCNWEHLPNALHHKNRDAMFSGGGAVDWKNTGGWKTGKEDVIIITWTSTGRGECIAYSNDKGRTFTEYEGNPIIKHKGRDPKPMWFEYDKDDKPLNDDAKKLGGHWVIAVYDEKGGRNIAIYTSTDLKKWTEQSHIQGYFECAEIFELPVDAKPAKKSFFGRKKKKSENTLWVIFAADAKYAIGDFDGKTFTPEHEGKQQLHWGPYYASQCFSDAPDGRVIQIGWARIDMGKDACFNQTFSFPTELTLRTTKNGVRMFGEPVKEIENIHGKTHSVKDTALAVGKAVEFKTQGDCFDIRGFFEVGTAEKIKILIDGKEEASINCKDQALDIVDGKASIQILIDRPMKEVFINGGQQIHTTLYKNDLNIESVKVVADGGDAKIISMDVIELNASWKQ